MTTLSLRRALPLILALAILAALLPLAAEARPNLSGSCANMNALKVPGAEKQRVTCYADLTTAGLPKAPLLPPYSATNNFGTYPSDWSLLNDPQTVNPTGVPGIQIDGYFPDTPPPAPYTPNPFNGWNHDAQFVIRLPDNWNGGLVIAPPPGNRGQYSSDFIISDYVLSKGYAYASTDKGNFGVNFYLDGQNPGDAVAEWHARVAELTKAARKIVNQRYGVNPQPTLLFGISNGGYQVRYAVENNPGLYDGGLDWEGTLFTRDGPNLFTYLPTALKQYPIYAGTSGNTKEAARQAMLAAGFAPGSEQLWLLHYVVYWDLTQRVYREEFDPDWDGAGVPTVIGANGLPAPAPRCNPTDPLCDANYDYAGRPEEVKDAVARISMTGKIKRPLITVQGSLDSLITPKTNAEPYVQLIADQGRSDLHRYYVVENGQHVDGFVPGFPAFGVPAGLLEPVLPCARAAFDALETWVNTGVEPPASDTIARAAVDTNSCALP